MLHGLTVGAAKLQKCALVVIVSDSVLSSYTCSTLKTSFSGSGRTSMNFTPSLRVKERALMARAGAYNGGLGAEPPAGSRGIAPGQGDLAPLKLKSFLLLDVHWKRLICPYSPCIADSVNQLNFQSNTDSGG